MILAKSLTDCILRCVEDSGRKFVFIIDEWDALIREAKNDTDTQKRYLDLLREWFKNISFTTKAVAAAYMTGILPIKKDGSQSAISDFDEYTVDVAYLPKYDSEYPILLIELKWNKDVQTAIDQIKTKHYPDSFKGYGREIILVGITYDKETKKHFCKIEKMPIE